MKSNSKSTVSLYLLILTVVIYYIFIQAAYLNYPILERHGFRQTQTAITSYYLYDGFKIDYETPVLGTPWTIPFEFPIYQYVSALFAKYTGVYIDSAGKIINCIFTLLLCFPVCSILKKLDVNHEVRLATIACIISSPLYLYWSTTFMIESTALLFSLLFIQFTIDFFVRLSFTNLVFLELFLILSLLQKATTVLPIIAVLYMFAFYLPNWTIRKQFLYSLAILIPLIVLYYWVAYTDYLKSMAVIGNDLTSSSLFKWNFGSFQQRLSKDLINGIFRPIIQFPVIGALQLLIIAFATIFYRHSRLYKLSLVFLLMYLAPFLIFTNLHIIHDYYQIANYIYFIIAISLMACAILYSSHNKPFFLNTYVIIVVTLGLLYSYLYIKKSKPIVFDSHITRILDVAKFVDSHTKKNEVLIYYGLGWSSELPYYSMRRGVGVVNESVFFDILADQSKYTGKYPLGAFVLCPNENPGITNLEDLTTAVSIHFPEFEQKEVYDCIVYFKN